MSREIEALRPAGHKRQPEERIPALGLDSEQPLFAQQPQQQPFLLPPTRRSSTSNDGSVVPTSVWTICEELVRDLLEEDHALAFFFGSPMEESEAPGFAAATVHPMDFGIILSKLAGGRYNGIHELLEEVQLIWQNCRSFFHPGSAMWSIAERGECRFLEGWQQSGLDAGWAGSLHGDLDSQAMLQGLRLLQQQRQQQQSQPQQLQLRPLQPQSQQQERDPSLVEEMVSNQQTSGPGGPAASPTAAASAVPVRANGTAQLMAGQQDTGGDGGLLSLPSLEIPMAFHGRVQRKKAQRPQRLPHYKPASLSEGARGSTAADSSSAAAFLRNQHQASQRAVGGFQGTVTVGSPVLAQPVSGDPVEGNVSLTSAHPLDLLRKALELHAASGGQVTAAAASVAPAPFRTAAEGAFDGEIPQVQQQLVEEQEKEVKDEFQWRRQRHRLQRQHRQADTSLWDTTSPLPQQQPVGTGLGLADQQQNKEITRGGTALEGEGGTRKQQHAGLAWRGDADGEAHSSNSSSSGGPEDSVDMDSGGSSMRGSRSGGSGASSGRGGGATRGRGGAPQQPGLCDNCHATHSYTWRKHPSNRDVTLCLACSMYTYRTGAMRPPEVWRRHQAQKGRRRQCFHCLATETRHWYHYSKERKDMCVICWQYMRRHRGAMRPLEDRTVSYDPRPYQCSHCGSTATSSWRTHPTDGSILCSACQQYMQKHNGQSRPQQLWQTTREEQEAMHWRRRKRGPKARPRVKQPRARDTGAREQAVQTTFSEIGKETGAVQSMLPLPLGGGQDNGQPPLVVTGHAQVLSVNAEEDGASGQGVHRLTGDVESGQDMQAVSERAGGI